MTVILILVDVFRMVLERSVNKTGRNGDQRKNQNHLDHSTVKISKNTRLEETFCHSDFIEKPTVKTGMKNS